jgi:hypothetical protein
MAAAGWRLVDLPKIEDPRGHLTFVEGHRHVPFDIQRVYYVYDVPAGADRGGHAHKTLHQLIIAASGSFDVAVDDGQVRQRVHLDQAFVGLYLPPMHWRDLTSFSSGSVCLVLASAPYDRTDYIHDYREFLTAVKADR